MRLAATNQVMMLWCRGYMVNAEQGKQKGEGTKYGKV